MKRQHVIGWMVAGVVALSATSWLCAQEGERPRPPQGEGREGGPGFGRGQQQFRPIMGMPASMAATADYVFILRGNTLYKYDAKTLKLEGKAEVEMPMPPRGPQQESGGDRRPPLEGGDRRPPPQQ